MARRPCNLLQWIGELKKLRSGLDISLKQDYGAHFVGCNKGFDVIIYYMTIEANDKELLILAQLLK